MDFRRLIIFFSIAGILGFAGCGSQPEKPVLHLFSDAEIVESAGLLDRPDDIGQLKSVLTYPNHDALWVTPWHGK